MLSEIISFGLNSPIHVLGNIHNFYKFIIQCHVWFFGEYSFDYMTFLLPGISFLTDEECSLCGGMLFWRKSYSVKFIINVWKFQQHRIWKRCSKEIWSYFVNKKSGFKVRLLSILYARGKLCFEKIFFIGMQNCNYSERESFCYGTFVMVMYWNLSI